MAEKAKIAKAEDRVEIFVPRAEPGEDPNLFISVNSKNYLLPKGKKSLVPAAVAYEFERSQEALAAWYDSSDALREAGNKPINNI